MMASSSSNTKGNIVEALPNELLTEILARVASSSVSDFFNFKSTGTLLNQLGNDDYVFQNASLEKFPLAPWPLNPQASAFLRKCMDCGNPEAQFRQGMLNFFSLLEFESGICLLNKAVQKGHTAATYVYGILYLCSEDDDYKQEGVKLISLLKHSEIRACRDKVKRVVREMWLRLTLDVGEVNVGAKCECGIQGELSTWDDVQIIGCKCCFFYPEVVYFQKLLNE